MVEAQERQIADWDFVDHVLARATGEGDQLFTLPYQRNATHRDQAYAAVHNAFNYALHKTVGEEPPEPETVDRVDTSFATFRKDVWESASDVEPETWPGEQLQQVLKPKTCSDVMGGKIYYTPLSRVLKNNHGGLLPVYRTAGGKYRFHGLVAEEIPDEYETEVETVAEHVNDYFEQENLLTTPSL